MIKNNKGFTMMELMVTVILLAILSALALPQYFKVVERQKGIEAVNILSQIAKAQERFHIINDAYTTDFKKLDAEFTDYETKQPPTGNTLNIHNFSFTLAGTNDTNGKATANRHSGAYSFTRKYVAGNDGKDVCCSGDADLCALFAPEVPSC